MVRIRCLNTLAELRDSGYGQPYPRHGLKLLYWFAKECVQVYNNQMMALCNPSHGDFGFRPFQNNDRLLPAASMAYYEVGNLNDYNDSCLLPEYVSEGFTGYSDESNMDRIIVCLDSIWFDSIYVTCHKTQRSTFDRNQTYSIDTQLIRTIRKMERNDFLRSVYIPIRLQCKPQSKPQSAPQSAPQSSLISSQNQNKEKPRNEEKSCCEIFLWVFVAVITVLLWLSYITKH